MTSSSATSINARFLDVPLTAGTMDVYVVRHAILRAVEEALPQLSGVLLDVGCGESPYRDLLLGGSRVTRYIGLDFASGVYAARHRPDLTWDGDRIPLDDASVDCALATEMLEHSADPVAVLREIRRVLVPGGVLMLTVPFLWPLHDAPHDEYRYTPWSLERCLRAAGFGECDVAPLGGWHASFAQMIGLWVRRAPMSAAVRADMESSLFPLFQRLAHQDEPTLGLSDGQMITGLRAIARVPAAVERVAPPAATARVNTSARRGKGLAVVWSNAGALTETFIRRHVESLAPAHTVVLAQRVLDRERIGAPVIVVPEGPSGYYTEIGQAAIASAFAEYDVGAILLEYGMENTAFVELHARAFAHIPLVVHFHGYDASRMLRDPRVRALYARLSAGSSHIVAVSEPMASRLVDVGFARDRVHVIPYSVDAAGLPVADPRNDPCHFVAVGRMVAKKAPLAVLEAFRRVHAEIPATQLTMAGDGVLMPAAKAFVRQHGLEEAVRLVGACEHREALALIAKGAVFVQHSVVDLETGDAEGLPNSILEASGAGLPVVATRHEGIPEAVLHGTTGWIVDEHDVDGMATYMLVLARDPGMRQRMGSAGRRRMLTEYTPAQQRQRLLAVLNRDSVEEEDRVASQPFPRAGTALSCLVSRLGGCATATRSVVVLPEAADPSPWVTGASDEVTIRVATRIAPTAFADRIPAQSSRIVLVQQTAGSDAQAVLAAVSRRLAPGGELLVVDAQKAGLPVCSPLPRSVASAELTFIAEGRYESCAEGVALALANGIAHDDGVAGARGFVRIGRLRRVSVQVNSYDIPTVSILIPTHNRASYVREAITSALMQGDPRLEVIVVDDGSSDDTAAVVAGIRDARVRYIAQERRGAPFARNRALAEARAPWCLWLDSDDALLPGALAALRAAVTAHPDADVVYGDLMMADSSLRPTGPLTYPDWYGRAGKMLLRLTQGCPIPNPGTMFRRALVEAVGDIDTTFRRAHDYEWWTRLVTVARFHHCGQITCLYRQHGSMLTGLGVPGDTSPECRVLEGLLTRHASRVALIPDRRNNIADSLADAAGLLAFAQSIARFGGHARAAEMIDQSNVVIQQESLTKAAESLRRHAAA